MRHVVPALILLICPAQLLSQTDARGRRFDPLYVVRPADAAIKLAAEELAPVRKLCERDLAVLRHLRAADAALLDSMQPAATIQKAYEEVDAAKAIGPDFLVVQGVIRSLRELEAARRSSATADLERLRSLIRVEAVGPASRLAVRNAKLLQEETLAWIKVQEQIAQHLRALSEIAADSLVAVEE